MVVDDGNCGMEEKLLYTVRNRTLNTGSSETRRIDLDDDGDDVLVVGCFEYKQSQLTTSVRCECW